MGIFVGTKQQVAAFRSSGGVSTLSKGAVSTSVRNVTSGIISSGGSSLLAKVGSAISKAFAPARVASGIITADKAAAAAKLSPVQAVPTSGNSTVDKVLGFVKKHPVLTAGAAALAVGGTALAVRALSKPKKKRKSRSSKRTSPRRRRSTRRVTRRRTRRSYGSEAQYKRRGGLDVKYTKNGQPYVIQRNGRARFIKRSR